mmetsp:Transcript_5158/g.5917  ORF Transcript_5158/g.5917 Transcript_5158/m.5917 type:complete len:137 (+) Transcript_5158:27-437(+)
MASSLVRRSLMRPNRLVQQQRRRMSGLSPDAPAEVLQASLDKWEKICKWSIVPLVLSSANAWWCHHVEHTTPMEKFMPDEFPFIRMSKHNKGWPWEAKKCRFLEFECHEAFHKKKQEALEAERAAALAARAATLSN